MSKSCSESFFNLHTLFMREAKALARSCVHAVSSEPSPHADVIRTIISCADQFIVLIFHCGPLFYFVIQYYNLNSSNFETLSERIYLDWSVSLLSKVIRDAFSHNGLKTTTSTYRYKAVKHFTGE